MDNKTKAKIIARHLISKAKECNKVVADEFDSGMTMGYDEIIPHKGGDIERYGKIVKEIHNQLRDMDPASREAVMTEISELSAEADKGIEENGGSWRCDAGDTKRACNEIQNFYHSVMLGLEDPEDQDTPSA